jgi:hypothetical protein
MEMCALAVAQNVSVRPGDEEGSAAHARRAAWVRGCTESMQAMPNNKQDVDAKLGKE